MSTIPCASCGTDLGRSHVSPGAIHFCAQDFLHLLFGAGSVGQGGMSKCESLEAQN